MTILANSMVPCLFAAGIPAVILVIILTLGWQARQDEERIRKAVASRGWKFMALVSIDRICGARRYCVGYCDATGNHCEVQCILWDKVWSSGEVIFCESKVVEATKA